MDEKRKSIIINEIQYWKKNRLLPDKYCDFLLALYSEGNTESKKENNKHDFRFLLQNLLLLLLIPIAVFLFYFTEMSFILQITIVSILLLFLVISIFYYAKKSLNFQILLVTGLLLFLFITVEIISYLFHDQQVHLYITVFVNCFFWFILSKKLKITYLNISSILGVVLLVVSIFI